jgi:U4/U6.U5 tri-snRNP-associated protein 1
VRNRRELKAKLKGTTLGDANDDIDNTKTWLKKSKKRGKELEAKGLKELEDMNNAVMDVYDESG